MLHDGIIHQISLDLASQVDPSILHTQRRKLLTLAFGEEEANADGQSRTKAIGLVLRVLYSAKQAHVIDETVEAFIDFLMSQSTR